MSDVAVLSVEEGELLTDLECQIERGLKTFVEVGVALAAIRDSRLYRSAHRTFEAYCLDRWGFSDRRASQFIEAASVVPKILGTGLPAPAVESQARELAKLPEPERADVWRETVERTDGKPTAAAIRETVESKQDPVPVESGPTHTSPRPVAGRYLSPPTPDPDVEAQRQRRVATHQLCETVVAVAQMRGFDTGWKYDPAEVLPGRAVTAEVISDARQAIDELAKIWYERKLP